MTTGNDCDVVITAGNGGDGGSAGDGGNGWENWLHGGDGGNGGRGGDGGRGGNVKWQVGQGTVILVNKSSLANHQAKGGDGGKGGRGGNSFSFLAQAGNGGDGGDGGWGGFVEGNNPLPSPNCNAQVDAKPGNGGEPGERGDKGIGSGGGDDGENGDDGCGGNGGWGYVQDLGGNPPILGWASGGGNPFDPHGGAAGTSQIGVSATPPQDHQDAQDDQANGVHYCD